MLKATPSTGPGAWAALALLTVLSWSGLEASAQATGLAGDTSSAPRCEVDVELMGVVYNDRKPERSFAMVSYKRKGTRMVYVGSRIAGKRIGAILPMAIWLGPVDSPCWLPLAHDAPAAKARRPAKKKKRKKRRRSRKRR